MPGIPLGGNLLKIGKDAAEFISMTEHDHGEDVPPLMTEKRTHLQEVFQVAHRRVYKRLDIPKIVCLCGSTRFYEQFQQANYELTMQGNIVLSVGFYMHSSEKAHGEGVGATDQQKVELDKLHLKKIDLADEIFVINVGGYVGESTMSEIAYAIHQGKHINWLEEPEGGTDDWLFLHADAIGIALLKHRKAQRLHTADLVEKVVEPEDRVDTVGFDQDRPEKHLVVIIDDDGDVDPYYDEDVDLNDKEIFPEEHYPTTFNDDDDDEEDFSGFDITTPEGVEGAMEFFKKGDHFRKIAEHQKALHGFTMKIQEKLAEMDDKVRYGYRKKVVDLADDLTHLLGVSVTNLAGFDDQRRAIVLQLFLLFSDDDDDGDEEVEPEPQPDGEEVLA